MQAQREPGTRVPASFPPRDSGEGGPPKAVGGARDSTLLLQRNRNVESDAPSTAQTRGPPPPLPRGGCNTIPVSRRTPRASDVKQRCHERRVSPLARMSGARSGYDPRAGPLPEFHFVQPGYATLCGSLPANKRKEAERRQTRSPRPVRKRRTGRATEKAACAALPLRARSPAGVPPRHLRQRPNATAQLQFTRFLGRTVRGGCYSAPGRPSPAGV